MGERNALLSVTLRAFVLRMKTTDEFNGRPVMDFKKPSVINIEHDLIREEQALQESTRSFWGPNSGASGLALPDNPKEISLARAKAIHPLCPVVEDTVSLASTRAELKEKTKKDYRSSRIDEALSLSKDLLREDSTAKILIFSDSLLGLDIMENALVDHGITCTRHDWTLPDNQREENVRKFQLQNDIRFFLINSMAGCIGLTLTRVRFVIVLNPAWNHASEEQCRDLVGRIVQTQPVRVYRLAAKQSIEQHDLRLQKDKERKPQTLLDSDWAEEQFLDRVCSWDKDALAGHVSWLSCLIMHKR
jgi:SNF2 family DNA or RNA helicase